MMHRLVSLTVVLAVIVVASATVRSVAFAGNGLIAPTDAKSICRQYADLAVRQYWSAVNNCPFRLKDLRWHPNWRQHYNWCLQGNNRGQPASNETNARYSVLDTCKPGSGGPILAP